VGTHIYVDGSKYVGKWKNGAEHGQGVHTWLNGDKYIGEYRDSKRHGQGTYISADGNKYVGEFKNNKRHGQGTLKFGSKSKFADDKYVGEFRNVLPNGQGSYISADGHKYVGKWKDGKYNGQGTFIFSNGDKEEGMWNNGKLIKASKGRKENSLYRVIDEAVIRDIPARTGKVVKHRTKGRILHVTRTLPIGWFQVSEEGEPIGWVHNSLVEKRDIP
jgi:hypothetical protein